MKRPIESLNMIGLQAQFYNIDTFYCITSHDISGVYKKLEAAGRKKGCEKVLAWARSVSNHLYWCAASSNGDGELVQQKWLSILNHVCNIHEGHGDRFPECEHGNLEDRVWMKKGMIT